MIEVIPFRGVDKILLKDICAGAQVVLRVQCKVSENFLKIPENAFNERRAQYDSKHFLDALQEYGFKSSYNKVFGITSSDLFTEGLNFIFGQAYIGGKTGVMSLHRLDPAFYGGAKNPALYLQRAIKEAIHELGHCFGLEHCPDKNCVMVFSNSVIEVDRKSRNFCKSCETKL